MQDHFFPGNLSPFMAYIAQQPDTVFWIRNLDFSEQIYVSDRFESIWGMNKSILFDKPESFFDTLIQDDLKDFKSETLQRILNQHQCKNIAVVSNVYYRIKRPDGLILPIHDFNFILRDDNNVAIAQCGISTKINEQQWNVRENILPADFNIKLLING